MADSAETATVAEVRAAVASVTVLLQGLSSSVHQVPNGELGELVGELGNLAAWAVAGQVVATAEADDRGAIEESRAKSTAGWVRDQDWHCQAGAASSIAKAAAIVRRRDVPALADAVRGADLPPNVAVTVAQEFDKLCPELQPGARDAVLDQMIEAGATCGSQVVRDLRELLLTQYGRDGIFQEEQDGKARYVELSQPREVDGVFHYRLQLDAEGKAVLEAAIGPLAGPQPGPDGEPDMRSAGRRRGEALVAVCRRSAAAAEGLPVQAKASLFVMISEPDLAGRRGAGGVVGSAAQGTVLAAETVRKLACDAAIIPVLRNHRDEILNVGTAKRYFTVGQIKALWLRDQHCTFDGCDTPAHWTDAHHLKHWADGGPTSLDNAALICGRHHTVVHRDRLAGRVVDGRVVWDRTPGSYDQLLTAKTSG
ncbi:HNH endonuclease signature motif containing protein [Nakamurella lactea]|uniref:HNH endonuclease signature motif containing protein n=1 Tax=Nakamurella lactea TaxID=459515 RepID=UPI00048D5E35|nr:HNH endonuclease signature motif containing protein [Nakamurella lactea]